MKVRISSFMRRVHNEVLFCNPQTGAAMICTGVDDFLLLTKGWDLHLLAEQISKKYCVVYTEVETDIMQFYNELADQGLVQIHTESAINVVDNLACNDKVFVSDINRPKENYPVDEFYKRNTCLANMHIDLTDACSEKCVHCYVPQGQHDFLSNEVCEKVLREFREQQGLTAQLSGGECMLHPDFAKICRLCRTLDLNFIVMSNLTLCDENIVALLKETEPQFVNVSLYSMAEKEHDAITRVQGSWRKTRTAIDALQNAGVAVRLATPLLKANQNAYSALKAFAKERRIHLIPDCDIIPRCGGDCSNLNYACTPEEIDRVLAGDKGFWDRGYGKNQSLKPEDKVCDIGQLLSLNSKGLYYPCSGMHEYVLGDARKMTLTDVWKGEKMKYLRGLKNKDFPQCLGCEHRAFCKVCPAFNFNATGSLFETIPAKCAVSAVKHKVFGGE